MSESKVTIFGLTFWAPDRPAAAAGREGFYFRRGGLEGVRDGLDVRRKSVSRVGDGAFPGRSKLAERVVPMSGYCYAKSAEDLDQRASELKGLQSLRDEFPVTFDFPGKTLRGMGHVSDKPVFKTSIAGWRANWALELQFDDPVLYGDSEPFDAYPAGSSFELIQRGNTPSPPAFTIEGNFPGGYTLNLPGGLKYQVTQPVTSGSPHAVDMSDGYLRIGGSIIFGKTPLADTVQVPGGGSLMMSMSAPSGFGTVTPHVTSRYI